MFDWVGLTEGISTLCSMDAIAVILLGTTIGIVFGALPGLSGCVALAVMIPLSYGMKSTTAMFLFSSIIGSVVFGGSISAILINTPGTPQNAATCFDGFPLAQRGEGNKALAMSATASGLGAFFGIIVLFALMPVMRRVVLLFGPSETLMLILFGLIAVAFASKEHILKGLVAGGIGILISLLGYCGVFGCLRFTHGSEYLWDGIQLVPFFIGLFALSELMIMATKGGKIAKKVTQPSGSVRDGIKEVFRHPVTFFRSSALGTLIGIIPGIGGSVATFVAYSVTVQSSDHPETFGSGDVEGVIAPEASNNAKDGGAMVPALAFGIPGNPETAVLLGAFILHGIAPGPMLMREHMDVVWAILFGLLLSNILTSTVGLMLANQLVKLTFVNIRYIVPLVTVLCFVGAFSVRGNLWDVALVVVAGFFGYGMKKFGFPVICLVIGFVLGNLAELSFHHAVMTAYGRYTVFFTRPISLTIFIIVIIVLMLPFIMRHISKGRSKI